MGVRFYTEYLGCYVFIFGNNQTQMFDNETATKILLIHFLRQMTNNST